jgi:hypothetical protein
MMKNRQKMMENQTAANNEQGLTPATKWAFWGSILFSVVFTSIIWWAGQFLDRSSFLPDQGPSWYYWKLPNPTVWTRLSVWGFYAAHQLTMWGLIYAVQKQGQRSSRGLRTVNWIALGANAFFIGLHFIQTHLWYDGLAQDVSIWSSQGSVILMLVMILLMENQRRGLFWGKKVPIPKETSSFVRKYHGYVFAWATVYTFWYHPMESTLGHLVGFFYMFLLLLQGSLMNTRIHTNRVWMVVQEVTVLFHGTLVALIQGNGMWPMFFFGFGGLFVLTQMHGLRLRSWMRWGFLGLYVIAALVTYSIRDISMLHQITWIPVVEYAGVFLLAAILSLALKIIGRQKLRTKARGAQA